MGCIKAMYNTEINFFKNQIDLENYEESKKATIINIDGTIVNTKELLNDLNSGKKIIKNNKKLTNIYAKNVEEKKIPSLESQKVLAKLDYALSTQKGSVKVLNTEDKITFLGIGAYSENIEDKILGETLKNLHEGKFFENILKSNKPINPSGSYGIRFTDFGGENVTTSIQDMKTMHNKLQKMIKNKKGVIHVIDTETLGATDINGRWSPYYITEFAKKTTDLSNNTINEVNIFLTNPMGDTTKYTREYKRIVDILNEGKKGIETIKNDSSLRVSIDRFALYGSDKTKIKFDEAKGYSYVSSIASIDDIESVYDLNLIKKGYEKMLEAEKNVKMIEVNGRYIKADLKEYIDSIAEIQKSMEKGGGILSGYNINKFDIKVINANLQELMKNNEDIKAYALQAFETSDVLKVGINNSVGGKSLRSIIDLQDYARVYTKTHGKSSLIGKDIYKEIFGQRVNRQEYIGRNWYSELMKDASHAAMADVRVASAFLLENADGLNETLFEHMFNGIIEKQDKYKSVNLNQNNISRHLFVANKSEMFSNDRGQLNFVTDRKGNVFFKSGHSIVNGKFQYDNIYTAPISGIKKEAIYSIHGITSYNTSDFFENLGINLPEYSSNQLHVVKMQRYASDDYLGMSDEGFIYKIFDTREEAEGFVNSQMTYVGSFDKHGKFTMDKKAKNKITPVYSKERKGHKYFGTNKKWKSKTDLEKLNEYTNMQYDKELAQRGWGFVTGNKSAKKIAGVLDLIEQVKSHSELDMDMFEDTIAFSKYYFSNRTKDFVTKSGKTYTSEQFKKVAKIMEKSLGYENKLLPTTALNAIQAVKNVQKLQPYYENLLNAIAPDKEAKDLTLLDKEIFSEVNDLIFSHVSTKKYGLNEKGLKKSSKVRAGFGSLHNIKGTYDFRLSEKFYRTTQLNPIFSYNVFNQMGDIFSIDLNTSDPSTVFLSNLLKRHMGNIEVNDLIATEDYTRSAFASLIREIKENSADHVDLLRNKEFNKMAEEVLSNESFDVLNSTDILLNSIKQVKNKKASAGVIRKHYDRTQKVNSDIIKELNNLSSDEIKNFKKKVRRERFSAYDETARANQIEEKVNDIISHYIFDKKELDNITFKNKIDKNRTYRLYDKFEAHTRNVLSDLLNAAYISNTNVVFDTKTGELILTNGKNALQIKDIARLSLDDGTMNLYSGSNTPLHYFETLFLDEKGHIQLGTNLGEKYGKKDSLTKKVTNMMNEGTFELNAISRWFSSISSDYKESPMLNFSKKDSITGNGMINIAGLDPIVSYLFNDVEDPGNKRWRNLVDKNKIINPDRIEKYLRNVKSNLEAGDLSPSSFALIISDLIPIFESFVDHKDIGSADVLEVIRNLNNSGKDTNVADKILQTNTSVLGNTFNIFDGLGRPTIVSQLNARYFRPILKSNTVAGTKHIYENLLIQSSVIETNDIKNNIYKNLKLGLKNDVNIQTDFTHSVAYLGTIGLDNTIASEMERVISEFKFNGELNITDPEETIKNMYGKLYNQYMGRTFEQARIMDARMIHALYGEIPQDVQKISNLKDIKGAIKSMEKDIKEMEHLSPNAKEPNKIKSLFDVIGDMSVEVVNNEVEVKYKKAAGTIVKRGDTIVKTGVYGGRAVPYGGKFDTGVLNFNVRTKEGIELTEEEISQILTKEIKEQMRDRLVGKSNEQARKMIEDRISKEEDILKLMIEAFDKKDNYKGAFEIANANTAEFVKTGNAEKGITLLPLTKAGELDNTLKDILEDIGASSHIGRDTLSPEAIKAYINDSLGKMDSTELKKITSKYNVKNIDELIEKAVHLREIEQYEASRMIFGKTGIFKGEVSAVFNDNVLGHGNYGLSTSGTLSKAIELYGRHKNGSGTKQEQYERGVKEIVDLINNNEEYQFLKRKVGDKTLNTKLQADGTTIIFGDELHTNLDDYDYLDIDVFNKFIERIDDEIKDNKDLEGRRLVHENVKILNRKTGKYELKDKVIGDLFIIEENGEKIANGTIANSVTKIINDSEVQSFVSAEYLSAREELKKKMKELEIAEGNNDQTLIRALKNEIHDLKIFTESQDEFSREMKIDDQARNILSLHKMDKTLERDLNRLHGEKSLSSEFLSAAKDYLSIDPTSGKVRIKDEFLTDNVYEGWIEEVRGLMTFDPTKEIELTKDMLSDENYAKFAKLHEFVTGKDGMNMKLGVDSAQSIYNIQGSIHANKFNQSLSDNIREKLINDYGYRERDISEFVRTFGKNDQYVDSMLNQGYIIKLNAKGFNEEIAIPGLNSVSGDKEIFDSWTSAFNSLKDNWDKYVNYTGDTSLKDNKEIEIYKNNIIEKINEIKEISGKIISKDENLGNLSKIEANSPYSRQKLLSLSDPFENRALVGDMVSIDDNLEQYVRKNSFKDVAKINGKTLREWEKGGLDHGVFFDYGVANLEDFKRMGFFDDKYLKALNMTEGEMVDYLKENGTMMLVDRYPNIRNQSIQNVRMFLDEDAPSGITSLAKHTMLKMNGDSDGDSVSKLLLQRGGVDYTAFNKIRENVLSKGSPEKIRDNMINEIISFTESTKNKVSRTEAVKIYEDFKNYEAKTTFDTLINIDSIAEQVLDTMFKDESKNALISGGVYEVKGLKNVGAQVQDGKSILGKIRIAGLEKSPGAFNQENVHGSTFYFENTSRINSYLEKINTYKHDLMSEYGIDFEDYKYLRDISPGEKLNIYHYGKNQHEALDEILSLIEIDSGSNGKNILNIDLKDAKDDIINRIRSDIYNQNSISKANKGVIGQVNASLYSIRQTTRDVYGASDSKILNTRNQVVQELGYQLEEHVISSKKVKFEPGDERLVHLSNIINDMKKDRIALSETTNELTDWITKYMESSTIDAMYEKTIEGTKGAVSSKQFTDEVNDIMSKFNLNKEDAIVKNKAHHLSTIFSDSVYNLSKDDTGKNLLEMYSIFGRRSGTLEKLADRVDLSKISNESYNATASFLAYGRTPDVPKVVPPTSPKQQPNSVLSNMNLNTQNLSNVTNKFADAAGDILKNISGSGLAMGVLGLAAGMAITGYASGNPLNDPKNDHMENKPEKINNMTVPDFFDEVGGYASINPQQRGYIVNIKADTRRGQKYAKKAMKQAVASSTGGAVNINMNFKSNNSGGYSDKDIEDILKNYI